MDPQPGKPHVDPVILSIGFAIILTALVAVGLGFVVAIRLLRKR